MASCAECRVVVYSYRMVDGARSGKVHFQCDSSSSVDSLLSCSESDFTMDVEYSCSDRWYCDTEMILTFIVLVGKFVEG